MEDNGKLMENDINLTNYDGKMQLEYCFIVLQQTINLYINCWHDSIVGYQLLVYASALYIYIFINTYLQGGWAWSCGRIFELLYFALSFDVWWKQLGLNLLLALFNAAR